jgi:hypothetical protein
VYRPAQPSVVEDYQENPLISTISGSYVPHESES